MAAKKFVLVLVLAAIVAGGVSAQNTSGKENYVSGTAGILSAGAAYERFFTPRISAGACFYWANAFILWNELEAGLFGRFYMWRGLYGELGLGFHQHTGFSTYKYEILGYTYTGTDYVKTTGVGITPAMGYKFDPGKPGGFFIEPGIKIPITIGKKTPAWSLLSSDESFDLGFGAAFGVVVYVGMGYAF